jgi:hypothetical protein
MGCQRVNQAIGQLVDRSIEQVVTNAPVAQLTN